MPETTWSFEHIAKDAPERALALENALSPDALLEEVSAAFGNDLRSGNARFGWEQAARHPEDFRTVLQFRVSAHLFDQFFNARTGYRAQFRVSPDTGHAYNKTIIEALRNDLKANAGPVINTRLLVGEFEDGGPVEVPIERMIASLDLELSKVWFCTMLIQPDEGRTIYIPVGQGPHLLVGQGDTWAAPYRDDVDAWLDVKGAFLGADGPYQPKDPIDRARKLQTSGEA